MAYAFTAVLTHLGGRDYKLVISETEAGAATESTIVGLPLKGQILAQSCTKVSGSAATVAPILILSSGLTSAVDTVCEATAAADQSNAFSPPATYTTTDGKLFGRTICYTGSDNTVVTTYAIKAGW